VDARWKLEDGTWKEIDCQYYDCKYYKQQNGGCAKKAIIRVLVPASDRIGYYQIDTGVMSYTALLDQLHMVQSQLGRYWGIPLVMYMGKEHPIMPDPKTGRVCRSKMAVNVMRIKYPESMDNMIAKYSLDSSQEAHINIVNEADEDDYILEDTDEAASTPMEGPIDNAPEVEVETIDSEIVDPTKKKGLDNLAALKGENTPPVEKESAIPPIPTSLAELGGMPVKALRKLATREGFRNTSKMDKPMDYKSFGRQLFPRERRGGRC